MPRAHRPWLVPVASLVVGLAWIVWLARDSLWSGAGEAQERAAPSQSAAAPLVLPPRVSPPATADPAVAPGANRNDAAVSPKARPKDAVAEVALQLAFTMPTVVQVGEAFDVRVSLTARQPIGRVVVEVAYDPAVLKARTLEEIDYAQRAPGERMFRIDASNDGQIELSLAKERGKTAVGLPASAPLVQFEALSPGRAQVRVASIAVWDPNGGALTWSAMDRELDIAVN